MTQQNILELARAGDANAIVFLMNRQLQPKGITAKVSLKNGCLQIMLEATQVPNQQTLVALMRKGFTSLGAASIERIKIYGRKIGEDFPAWEQECDLKSQVNLPISTSEIAIENKSSIPHPETLEEIDLSQPSLLVTQAQEMTKAEEASLFGSWFGAFGGAAGAIAGAASQASQAVAGTAVGVVGSIGGAAIKVTEGVGYVFDIVGNNPQLQQLTKALQIDWLIQLIDQVDIVKAETEVRRLQQQYPNEQPSEIAHRVMVEKALLAGGTGFTNSLVPGATIALFAVDLAANMALQAEMVFQIACAYGFDLKDPAIKGEIIAIFGLSVGGGQALKAGTSYAVKAGLTFLETIPFAGAAISASANAAMLYALGYSACRFYESKLTPLTMEATLVDAQEQSQKYLESAIAQEVIMDWILVHIVLAGHSGKSWEQMLPELQTANLSPASLEAIATNINSPPPLENLLEQINSDFAIPLLAQCQKIAQLDGVITSEESQVIERLANKFNLTVTEIT